MYAHAEVANIMAQGLVALTNQAHVFSSTEIFYKSVHKQPEYHLKYVHV